MFKLGAEDSTCSHILYAACHDASYLAPLVPYSGLRNKITLVQGAGFNSDFHQFGLPVTQFPTLFRWSELPTVAPTTKATSTDRTSSNPPKAGPSRPTTQAHSSHARDNSWGNSAYGFDTTPGANDSPTTYGQSDNNGWGKATDPSKYQTVPCKYFQKVCLPLPLIPHPSLHPTNSTRASANSATNAHSNTPPNKSHSTATPIPTPPPKPTPPTSPPPSSPASSP